MISRQQLSSRKTDIPATRPPIGEAARTCLRCHPRSALTNVLCEYCDGVLILRGHLPSYFLKQIAQETVRRVDGVEQIKNEIEVESPQWSVVGKQSP